MSPLILALSIVGAIAVLLFVLFVILGATQGWSSTRARWSLRAALIAAGVCALLGVLLSFIDQ